MSATDQLIIALATFIITISGLLGPAFVLVSHLLQSKQLKDNSDKLDHIDASTNGSLAAVKEELATLKADAARQHPPGAF